MNDFLNNKPSLNSLIISSVVFGSFLGLIVVGIVSKNILMTSFFIIASVFMLADLMNTRNEIRKMVVLAIEADRKERGEENEM